MKCRHCDVDLRFSMLDLGASPPSNAYLTKVTMRRPEKYFPLRVYVCESCWLVQAEAYSRAAELFNEEYAYFSSFSNEWVRHADNLVADAVQKYGLGPNSHVIEIASNDGYLLQHVQRRGIPCLGIEPTASTAAVARQKGIEVVQEFLSMDLAQQLVKQDRQADFMVAINVLAHVPEINDFAQACGQLLKKDGVFTCEFPHLYRLITERQFDTVYHEHFSYLSFMTTVEIFAKAGLRVFDVEEIGTHGGSLRVSSCRADSTSHPTNPRVTALMERERAAGMFSRDFYHGLQSAAEKIKDELLLFLVNSKTSGHRVLGYGAAAKGNTLLNFAGVKPDLLPSVADRSTFKQGRFLPGTRIPIVSPEDLVASRPTRVLVLAWNLRTEVAAELRALGLTNCELYTAIPQLEMYERL
ncbi:MAG: methyltransferase domain-containing protein [Ilumatobacteraceae bacterium]